MMFSDYFQMAIASIRANRLRSLLTLLGIIIGVAGVVTSVSIGEGVKQQIGQETHKLGQDVVSVRPGNVLDKDQSGIVSGINTLASSSQSGSVLSEKDLAAIRESKKVNTVVPLSLATGLPKTESREFNDSVIIGTTTNLPEMLHQKIEFGGFFSGDDEGKNVAVIGTRVAEKLFGEFAPLGNTFTLRGEEYIVRGVFESFESTALSQGIDFNNAIFIPYSTSKRISGGVQFYEILAKLNNKDQINTAMADITEKLKSSRGGEEDFTILRANDSIASTNSVIALITSMVVVIAAIAMIVGGIGIMNIMLVSVTERTREIGIRKAVGASDAQIGWQFLVEAAVLSIWGAIIGVVVSGLINLFLRVMTDLQPVIVPEVMAFAMVVSVLVGVLFGAAPAFKAAKKDPIEALRS